MRKSIVIFLTLSGLLWGGIRTYKYIVYKIKISGHLRRAATANTVKLAIQELETVIASLEKQGFTSGYTSLLIKTPDEDVGFWYQNLKASLLELRQVNSTTTQLEKSNILIRLHETLIDKTGGGESVTQPPGISIFPHNKLFALWIIINIIAELISLFLWFRVPDK